jgi:hypothetical protein
VLDTGRVRIYGLGREVQLNQVRQIERESIKMKPNKMIRLAPMKQLKGQGLGRQGYQDTLTARPKLKGAQSIEPKTLQMKKGLMGGKIKVQSQSLKGL